MFDSTTCLVIALFILMLSTLIAAGFTINGTTGLLAITMSCLFTLLVIVNNSLK